MDSLLYMYLRPGAAIALGRGLTGGPAVRLEPSGAQREPRGAWVREGCPPCWPPNSLSRPPGSLPKRFQSLPSHFWHPLGANLVSKSLFGAILGRFWSDFGSPEP